MINYLIEQIGFAVCHQIPSKSLTFGNITLPICARCSGIYMGFLVTAIILFLFYKKRESSLPPLWVMVILIIFILSTIIDGFLSYLNLMPTNNNIRFITGFLCGSGIMAIVCPIFVFQYYEETNNRRIFKRPLNFIIYIVIISSFITLTLLRFNALGNFYYYFSIFAVVFTFYFINLVMVLLAPFFAQKSSKLMSKYLLLPSISALSLMAFELFVSYKIHEIAARFAT